MVKTAEAEGLTVAELAARNAGRFREMDEVLNISFDRFIRTTEPRHYAASQGIWKAIAARQSPKGRDNIYLGKYAGWYAVRDEAFYGEDELTTGPDGKKRAPSGAEVEWVEEPSYFFDLSKWQDRLLRSLAMQGGQVLDLEAEGRRARALRRPRAGRVASAVACGSGPVPRRCRWTTSRRSASFAIARLALFFSFIICFFIVSTWFKINIIRHSAFSNEWFELSKRQ